MKYTQTKDQLIKLPKFSQQEWGSYFEHEISIHSEQFKSTPYDSFKSEKEIWIPKEIFNGYNSLSYNNLNFQFHVVSPKKVEPSGSIIFLHGLNERTWDKYITWILSLIKKTNKQVILFPISYHMERAPKAWYDPRQMQTYVSARRKQLPQNHQLSIANIALSERLTRQPEQFFYSGYESATEIIKLIGLIEEGYYKSIPKHSKIDFFGYSIGAFLSEILLLSKPNKRVEDAKHFFFCGGCTFDQYKPESKYILDSEANKSLHSFYKKGLKYELHKKSLFSELLESTPLGKAFNTMLSYKKLRKHISQDKWGLSKKVKIVGLRNDQVVPYKSLKKLLPSEQVEIMDFNFKYSHENPFPVVQPGEQDLVNSAFDTVFERAASFYCET